MTGIVLRTDRPLEFLREKDDGEPAQPAGVCIVSGGIVRRNLRERLASEGIAPDVARITTIEELATGLLGAADEPAAMLDRPRRSAAVEHVLESARDHDTPLGRFARRVPWENGDVLDGVVGELNEYYRCTDAAADDDHAALRVVVDAVEDDDPFSAAATRESLRAFAAIDRLLRESTDEHVSRSHLVRAARGVLESAWTPATGDPEWVALATVSALDNPTLRLLSAVAGWATLHVFAGPGTADQFETRLRAIPTPVEVRTDERQGDADPAADPRASGDPAGDPQADGDPDGDRQTDDPAASLLRAAADNETVTVDPSTVRTIAAPDRHREVAHAVRSIRAEPGALLVARDAGAYETPLRDVALTADRPHRVETRRELRTTPAYRAVAATLRLVAAASNGEVYPAQVLDPLRIGARPPLDVPPAGGGDATDPWPVSIETLDALDATLGRSPDPRGLSELIEAVERHGGLDPVAGFLSWVRERSAAPPASGGALGEVVAALVDAYAAAVADRPVRAIEGVAVETGRARVAEKHPAFFAGRVRANVPAAARCYDWLADALDRSPDWETATEAVRRGIGAESFGLPRDDADAVEVVDAGNAHFRRANRVFVLGLAAGEFPARPRRPSLIHAAVRRAVYRQGGERPYLYLDSRPARYDRDLDAYAAALRVGREGVVLVRPYKDADGRDVAASPFLDAVEVPAAGHTRVGMGEWVPALPHEGVDVSDRDAWTHSPHKERLRALAREANRPAGGADADTIRRLAGDLDPETSREVRARYDRLRAAIQEAEDD